MISIECLRKLFSRRRGACKGDSYADRFAYAVKVSHAPEDRGDFELKLQITKDDLCAKKEKFGLRLYEEYKISDLTYGAKQCLAWSIFMAPIFQETTNIKAWPTLGQLEYEDDSIYSISWESISKLKEDKLQLRDLIRNGKCDFHVWITLENGYILDPTYYATFLLSGENDKIYIERARHELICNEPHKAFPKHSYVPMLVGKKLLENLMGKSNMAICFEGPYPKLYLITPESYSRI